MSRRYPRRYLVVQDGKIERVTVKDAAQEVAIMFRHAEATGLSKYEPYDLSQDVIPDADQAEGE